MERTLAVAAGPAAVLGYLKDFANTPHWDPAAQQTTRNDAGPVIPGSTWHHVCKIFGVTAELTYTLITADPFGLLFHGRNEGATCTDTIALRPAGPGTEVTYRVELELHGLAKLATPVLKIEFEKLGTESVARLTTALNELVAPTPGRSAELHFPSTTLNTTPTRSQEAQA
ncbi:MAG TPA: SRPBCC family protein [Actinoplanes sp.]